MFEYCNNILLGNQIRHGKRKNRLVVKFQAFQKFRGHTRGGGYWMPGLGNARVNGRSNYDSFKVTNARVNGRSNYDSFNVTNARVNGRSNYDSFNVTNARVNGRSNYDSFKVTKRTVLRDGKIF